MTINISSVFRCLRAPALMCYITNDVSGYILFRDRNLAMNLLRGQEVSGAWSRGRTLMVIWDPRKEIPFLSERHASTPLR